MAFVARRVKHRPRLLFEKCPPAVLPWRCSASFAEALRHEKAKRNTARGLRGVVVGRRCARCSSAFNVPSGRLARGAVSAFDVPTRFYQNTLIRCFAFALFVRRADRTRSRSALASRRRAHSRARRTSRQRAGRVTIPSKSVGIVVHLF